MPLNNVNLSEYFWLRLAAAMSDGRHAAGIVREMPGIMLVLAYLLLLPPLLAKTIMRPFFIRMGFMRFFVLVTLIQFMACAADQDGAALDLQPEVHRVYSGMLLQHLTVASGHGE